MLALVVGSIIISLLFSCRRGKHIRHGKPNRQTEEQGRHHGRSTRITKLRRSLPHLGTVVSSGGFRNLDTAFQNFFSGRGKHPTFKKKGEREGFHTNHRIHIDTKKNRVRLGPIGWIRCRGLRSELEQRLTVQSITVSLEAGKWYASILCRMPAQETPAHAHPNRACGVDVGIAIPYTVSSSTGKDFCYGTEFSKTLAVKEAKRKRYQRAMKRKLEAYRKAKKGDPEAKLSNNFRKASAKVAKAHQRETSFKLDFQHKLTTKLAKSYGVICVEDLKFKSMTRSAKGNEAQHGKSVKQKRGLNRELLRLAHSRFVNMLEYKAKKFGAVLVKVDPKNTSRTCPCCGHVDKRNRKSQAVFECVRCGYATNADTNAAFNILCKGVGAMLVA